MIHKIPKYLVRIPLSPSYNIKENIKRPHKHGVNGRKINLSL